MVAAMGSVLVTGGAGYIGSVLVPELLKVGAEVTVVDNFMYRQHSLNAICYHGRLKIIHGDVRDRTLMAEMLRSHDTIIPLAAIVGASACDRDRSSARTTNLMAIHDMVALLSPNQRVIIPTTNSGYGIGGEEECTEESPLKPISAYGIYKVEAEKSVLAAGGISLRLATVFGMSPRMRLDLLVNDFVYRAMKDRALVIFEGHFRRNYIHVRDVAAAFIHAIWNYNTMKGQAYNVGQTSANMTKLELAYTLLRHFPDLCILQSKTGRDPDQRDYLVSNAKLEASGWKAEYSFDAGIRELIKGYQQFRGSELTNG